MLHGQNKKNEDAPLALFCLCTPFGPPSLVNKNINKFSIEKFNILTGNGINITL
jgi:hypothetical protein